MSKTTKWRVPGKAVYFAFTVIPVALYTFFYVVSVVNGVKYSFTDWDGMSVDYDYVGFKNYMLLFKNPNFLGSLKTTLFYSCMLVVVVILASLLLSISLNSLRWFKTFVKSIFFVPAMIGGVTIALIWDQLFYRVVPLIGQLLGIGWLSQSLLMTGKTALPAVVFVQAWQAVAMPTVIFIAGLQQIPEEQYESAKIDGAGELRIFFQIVLPLLGSGLATIGLFMALTYWNDWYNAMLFLDEGKRELYPLQYYLNNILTKAQAINAAAARSGIPASDVPSEPMKLAMTVVATGPIVLLYPFLQKYFVKGVTIGAVKG